MAGANIFTAAMHIPQKNPSELDCLQLNEYVVTCFQPFMPSVIKTPFITFGFASSASEAPYYIRRIIRYQSIVVLVNDIEYVVCKVYVEIEDLIRQFHYIFGIALPVEELYLTLFEQEFLYIYFGSS